MINKLTYPRELRLLTPFDFNHVFQNSLRASSPFITFVARSNDLNHPRLGFAIAKKQVKRAHDRNHIKRIVRDYFRIKQHELPAIDLIVMARSAAVTLSNDEIRSIADKLWQRLLFLQQNKK